MPTAVLTGAALRIDVERAREAVSRLRELTDEVSELHASMQFLRVTPAGSDAVSQNVAAQSTDMLWACRSYLASWRTDLEAASTALEAQIHSYQEVDRRNATRA